MDKRIIKDLMKKISISLGFFFLSVLVLILPALINKYPLLHMDCGTYIISGFAEIVPKDRPIFYGLFIRYISLIQTLWMVIVFQSVIGVYLLSVFLRPYNFKYPSIIIFILTLILYFLTGISHYVSQPTPDIFASYALLILLIFFKQKLSIWESVFLGIILIFSIISHLSHMIIITGSAFCFLIVFLILKRKFPGFKMNLLFLTGFIVLSWVIVPMANKNYSKDYSIAKYKSIIWGARLIEMDIIPEFLEENCHDNDYIFCEDIDELRSLKSVAHFVWLPSSPLFDGSCFEKGSEECWKEKAPEMDILIHDILLNQKYRRIILKGAITSTLKQFSQVTLKKFSPLLQNSPLSYPIKLNFPEDYKQYVAAKQAKGKIDTSLRNSYSPYIYFLSIILLLGLCIRMKKVEYYLTYILILLYYFINAAVCANFSNVVGRYQNRIAWVISFFLLVLILDFLRDKGVFRKTKIEI